MSDPDHLPECPRSRDRHSECICDLLRAVRLAARAPKREKKRDTNGS